MRNDHDDLLRKLYTMEPTITALFALSRPTIILERKIVQIEEFIMLIPSDDEPLVSTWRKKLAQWWKQYASLLETFTPNLSLPATSSTDAFKDASFSFKDNINYPNLFQENSFSTLFPSFSPVQVNRNSEILPPLAPSTVVGDTLKTKPFNNWSSFFDSKSASNLNSFSLLHTPPHFKPTNSSQVNTTIEKSQNDFVKPKLAYQLHEDRNYILSSESEEGDSSESEDTKQLRSIFPIISAAGRNRSSRFKSLTSVDRSQHMAPIVIESTYDDCGGVPAEALNTVKYRYMRNELGTLPETLLPDLNETMEVLRAQFQDEFSSLPVIRSDKDVDGIKALLRISAKAMKQTAHFGSECELHVDLFKLAFNRLPESKQHEYIRNYEQKTLPLLNGFLRNEIVTFYAESKRSIAAAALSAAATSAPIIDRKSGSGADPAELASSGTILASSVCPQDQSSILDVAYFCRYCRQSGHLLKECTALKTTLCFKCFEYGHSAKRCPSLNPPLLPLPQAEQNQFEETESNEEPLSQER